MNVKLAEGSQDEYLADLIDRAVADLPNEQPVSVELSEPGTYAQVPPKPEF